MTLQWIPLEALEPHPENSNRMPAALMEKLLGHIQRTGRYEPLVVRPLSLPRALAPRAPGALEVQAPGPAVFRAPGVSPGLSPHEENSASAGDNPELTLGARRAKDKGPRYQLLNGHHRAEVLRRLGHSHARCDVWEVDDDEARLLLATLNRLEGRDDPASRARLVSRLAESRPREDLAALLPEPPDAVERLLALAHPPGPPLDPGQAEALPRPMTFFLAHEEHALVREALGEIGKIETPKVQRAEALVRLALWYLESRNLR
jgi:hypothetical protein